MVTRPPVSETALQDAIVELAHLMGWKVAHFRPVRVQRADGSTYHETPGQYDARGWPDLVLVHPVHGLLVWEVKSHRGTVRPDQAEWLALLTTALPYGTVRVVDPDDWDDIERILRGGPR